MKTSFETPDPLPDPVKPWMAHFGGLKDLKDELARINETIRAEFEVIDPEMWR